MKKSFYILFLLLSCFINHINADDVKEITLNSAISGNQTYVARDAIYLKPGFSYQSGANTTFTAQVNEQIALPAEYVSTVPSAKNRTLDRNKYLVGSTPGQFSVSPSGAAIYQVPIEVPSGINGAQPSLSLVYNSQGGNGVLGWGFSLSGLSSISRVPKTVYSHGKAYGIKNTADDVYALDGNLLVSVNGTYGASGTEYRTQTETFSQVFSRGSCGSNGPEYFEVNTKEGINYKYGSASGRLLYSKSGKQSVQTWLLDLVTFPNGQTIKYEYTKTNLCAYVRKITYGVNTIEFFYDTREDVILTHFDQAKGQMDGILRKIVCKTDGAIYKQYDFEYTYSPGSTKDMFSRLVKVSENNGVSSQGTLYNPLIFEWGKNLTAISKTTTQQITVPVIETASRDLAYVSADIDGDGHSDLLSFRPGSTSTVQIYKCNATGNIFTKGNRYTLPKEIYTYEMGVFGLKIPMISQGQRYGGIMTGDIYGKGKESVVFPSHDTESANPNIFFYIVGDNGAEEYHVQISKSKKHPLYSVADINKDGKSEILCFEVVKPNNKYRLHILENTESPSEYRKIYFDLDWTTIGNEAPQRMFVSDFNGDGMVDIMITTRSGSLIFWNSGGTLNTAFSNDNKTTMSTICDQVLQPNKIQIGDFNGDGLPDILHGQSSVQDGGIIDPFFHYKVFRVQPSRWSIFINNGDKSFNATTSNTLNDKNLIFCDSNIQEPYPYILREESFNFHNDACFVADFNADGKSDIIFFDEKYSGDTSKTRIYWFESNGLDFNLKRTETRNNDEIKLNNVIWGDFTGKGLPEMLFLEKVGSVLVQWTRNSISSANSSEADTAVDQRGKITCISDGVHKRTYINYKPLTSSTVYTKGTSAEYPVFDIQTPLYVVRSVANNADGVSLTDLYSYEGAKYEARGRGFLGFSKTITTNAQLDVRTTSKYKILGVHSGNGYCIPALEETSVSLHSSPDSIISKTTYTPELYFYANNSNKRVYLHTSKQVVEDKLNNLSTTVETPLANMDIEAGNQLVTKKTTGNIKETTAIEYGKYASWCKNKPIKVTTKREKVGTTDIHIRVKSFAYDEKGNLTKETVDPGTTNSFVSEYKNLTPSGLAQTIEVTANGQKRTSTVTYTRSERFVQSETNHLGETTTYNWVENKGLLYAKTDLIGKTVYDYDPARRLKITTYPDGTYEKNNIFWTASGTSPLYYTKAESSGEGSVTTYYTTRGEDLSQEVYGLNNKKISIFKEYDTKRRLKRISESTFSTNTEKWDMAYTYDKYNRPLSETTPLGITTYAYKGRTSYITTPSEVRTTILNTAGQVETSIVNGKSVSYDYYASGLLKKSTPEGGASVETEYDLQGNRTKIKDPDAGTITYKYDGWGQLKSESQKIHNSTDSTRTSYEYYANGLVRYKTRSERTSSYGYNSKKRLSYEKSGSHSRGYTYDQYDRVTQVKDTIVSRKYSRSFEYDSYGRVSKEIYPGGYWVTNHYDANGHLTEIKDRYNNSIWKAVSQNERGQYTKTKGGVLETDYTYNEKGQMTAKTVSNGVMDLRYSYDDSGMIASKENRTAYRGSGCKEVYTYDNMNRLTNWNAFRGSNNPVNGYVAMSYQSAIYDANSNMIYKSDFARDMRYGERTGGPHALTSYIDQSLSGGGYYTPANTITYTDFKKVNTISNGSTTMSFTYGVDEQRVRVQKSSSGRVSRRYYLGNYEEEYTVSDNTETLSRRINYISGGNGLAAIYIQDASGNGTLYYTHTDHLGSLLTLTTANGSIHEKTHYGPWGAVMDEDNWTERGSMITTINRGFTMHEHIPEFRLINMNGRLYDPEAGQFLSPDPYIQAPDNWLNYNRYSYCMNNPVMYTDPDGELFFLMPYVNYSANGGWEFGLTAGFMWGFGSVSGTISYSTGSSDLSLSAGVSSMGLSASAGYSTCGGFFAGVNYGFGGLGYGGINISSNMLGVGMNYSQGNGFSINNFGLSMSPNGIGFNPGLGVSLTGMWGTQILDSESALGVVPDVEAAFNGGIYSRIQLSRILFADPVPSLLMKDLTSIDMGITQEMEDKGYSIKNGIIINKNGSEVGGSTVWRHQGLKHWSYIRLSPHDSKRNFLLSLNHELIHAYHWSKSSIRSIQNFSEYSEASASTYTREHIKTYPVPSYTGSHSLYDWPILYTVPSDSNKKIIY